jgi:hypothetical protein
MERNCHVARNDEVKRFDAFVLILLRPEQRGQHNMEGPGDRKTQKRRVL